MKWPTRFRIEISGTWPGHKSFWIVASEGPCGQVNMTDLDFDAFVHALLFGDCDLQIISPYPVAPEQQEKELGEL